MKILSTHPLPKTRIKRLEKLIAKKYPDAKKQGVYRFDAERFKSIVLDELAKLPPPKHPVKKEHQ